MDGFETPYEAEINYIPCEICKKSIRGESLYKIHLTTPAHLKTEDALIAQGAACRRQFVPEFKDILHFLDYLNLDEPIIGLDFLDEIPSDTSKMGSCYYCNLCSLPGHLDKMVNHLIGRKHRFNYLAMKRPDLVTWDNESSATKAGKIIRAKAKIVERQDGRGTPKPLINIRKESKSNRSRDTARQNWDPVIPQRPREGVPPLLPEFKQYQNRKRGSADYPNAPAINSDELNMNRGRRRQWEDTFSHARTQDDHQREDYEKRERYRDDFLDSDRRSKYEEQYSEEPRGRSLSEASDFSRFDHREDVQRDRAQQIEHYSEEKPRYQRSYPEREALNEFYPGEGDCRSVRSPKYLPSQQEYPEDDSQRWSQERESGGHERIYRATRQRSSEPEAKRRSLPEPVDNDHVHNHLFSVVRDYKHESSGLHLAEQFDNAGSSRPGTSSSHGRGQVSQTFASTPQPFGHFLKGDIDENPFKVRRKSRFSDATPEQVEVAKDMFSTNYGPNPNYAGNPRPLDVPSKPEMQYSDLYRESQSPHYTRSSSREGSRPERVIDLLDNIEIENAEEAKFLKSKLCSLLREFKSKNMQKEQNSPSQPGMARNYSHPMPEPQLPQRHQYERPMREDAHQSNDLYFRDDRRSSLKQRDHIPEDQCQENPLPSHSGVRLSHRSHYEEMFGKPSGNLLDDPPYRHEGFQDPLRSRDYLPPVQDFYDRPLHMEQESRMHRGPRYSNSLEKISSTLLELVSRK